MIKLTTIVLLVISGEMQKRVHSSWVYAFQAAYAWKNLHLTVADVYRKVKYHIVKWNSHFVSFYGGHFV